MLRFAKQSAGGKPTGGRCSENRELSEAGGTGVSAETVPGNPRKSGSGANKVDVITFIYDGTNDYGGSNLNY